MSYTKIKTFENDAREGLEKEINDFLTDNSDKMRYVDLKISVVQVDGKMKFLAFLIFEVDSSRSHFFF
jgi:hypothetical protein